MAGRPRKPTNIKLLAGNPSQHTLPKEREVDHGQVVKPAWLDANESLVWDELAPARVRIGVLTGVTCEEFGQLIRYIVKFRRSLAELKSADITDMRAKMNAFGFNPSALAKLGIAMPRPAKSANPFSQLTG